MAATIIPITYKVTPVALYQGASFLGFLINLRIRLIWEITNIPIIVASINVPK